MIGLVLVMHGALAEGFLSATLHVMGPQEALEAVGIGPLDEPAVGQRHIRDAMKRVDRGAGVILLTDLFGSTPSNLCMAAREDAVREDTEADVIAGVNLPLLIKLVEMRESLALPEAVAVAREAGQKYIRIGSEQAGS